MRWQREDIWNLKAVKDKPRAGNKELPVQREPVNSHKLMWTLIPSRARGAWEQAWGTWGLNLEGQY